MQVRTTPLSIGTAVVTRGRPVGGGLGVRGMDLGLPGLREAGPARRAKPIVVLTGHSYGGAVIGNAVAGDPDVEALVCVTGQVLDAGRAEPLSSSLIH